MANTCQHCGANLRPGALFCSACGGRQGQAAAGQPTVAVPLPASGLPGMPPAGVAPRLVIHEPGQPPYTRPLAYGLTTIGREGNNALIIGHPMVSRCHAKIEQRGAAYWLTDLQSRNGTSVNGRPLKAGQAYQLNHNDIIRIGDQQGNSVGLTFCSAPAAQPTGSTIYLGKLNLGTLTTYGIGREPTNEVTLNHPSVSRRHARVEQVAGGHVIRDLGSANGTYVQGQPVRGACPLRPGDVIQIGPFKLVYDTTGIAQFSPAGNFQLDGIGLHRVVQQAPPLTRETIKQSFRWLGHPTGQPPFLTPARKLILDDVSISIHPKEFVALVGGSGAGKSTLMNALSGFIPAQGRVLLNGDDLYANFAAYRSTLGYVPQDDIIHGQLTARSALRYAARLRLPDATPQEIEQRVTDALAQVEMTEHADSKPVNRLSGGQRKRVSIAAELLADPGLFFLDEPTSGLDPGLEKKMMYTMRQLADSGRTIILVTHATANIKQCTHVAFMADGKLAYFGPPDDALTFFQARDFADIYTRLSQPLDPVKNPPPTGYPLPPPPARPPRAAEVWAACYKASPQYQQYLAGRLSGNAAAGGVHPAVQVTRQKVSAVRQFAVLVRRYFELIRRDAMSLFILLAVMPIIGLLLLIMAGTHDLMGKDMPDIQGAIQQEISDKRAEEDPADSAERFSASYGVAGSAQKLLFMLALAANLLGMFAAAYEIVKEEPIYRRERMVNLQIGPYLASKLLVLGGFALVQCLLLLLIMRLKVQYPEKGLLLPAPAEMYITLFLAALAGSALGLLISSAVRSSGAVIYVVLLILFVQIIFAGAIFELPAAAKPISYMTATRWTLEALGNTVDMERLKGAEATCIEFEDERTGSMLGAADRPCEDGQMRMASTYRFNVDYDHTAGHLLSRWAVLLGFSVVLSALTWVVQRRKDVI